MASNACHLQSIMHVKLLLVMSRLIDVTPFVTIFYFFLLPALPFRNINRPSRTKIGPIRYRKNRYWGSRYDTIRSMHHNFQSFSSRSPAESISGCRPTEITSTEPMTDLCPSLPKSTKVRFPYLWEKGSTVLLPEKKTGLENLLNHT